MAPEKPQRRRCATYTRKSSEEGLEQDFNSLDAQREACEAYIKSQVGEGWKPVRTAYDDGGYSGGNLNRPGLQRLLVDIDAGKIDIVVVYKVDRLTRSLADFAKIVEVLDAHGVSFVSVTQQFNTTTSMGRLTLNMLLSFAQFEREVTGERIRDKIAASKRKGLWMGGNVPLGYEADGRTLKIVETEARIVRRLFRLYLEEGNVRRVKEEADRLGLKSKTRQFKDGSTRGGLPLGRGHIHRILNNPIYIGRIGHKGSVHEGQHEAIVDLETWEVVQRQLADQTPNRPSQNSASEHSPLRGKLFDEAGGLLTPSHTVKSGRRYRYYVSRESAAIQKADHASGQKSNWRLPARELEKAVEQSVAHLLGNAGELARAARAAGVYKDGVAELLAQAPRGLARPLELVQRVELAEGSVAISIDLSKLLPDQSVVLRHVASIRLRRRGSEMRLILEDDADDSMRGDVDPALIKAILRARRWFDRLAAGDAKSLEDIGRSERISDRYVGALMPLAFLAPKIVERILVGSHPIELTTEQMIKHVNLPAEWTRQTEVLGFD
ncbi:MAG: recombinase family protein [Sandaracinus sp.]|nr:recombinase family protein [Sandaracinus sp.]